MSIILAGPNDATWRTISAPIDPAEPELLADGFHVHPDLLAREKVLDADLAELEILDLVFAELAVLDAGFLGRLAHEYLAPCADEDVLNFLVFTEFLRAERADENALDALFLDYGRQIFVQSIDRNAHEAHVLDSPFVRNEAAEIELRGMLAANALGHADSAGKGAVDKHGHLQAVLIGHVEERLGEHPHRPLEQCRYRECRHGLENGHRRKQFDAGPFHGEREYDGEGEGKDIGIADFEEVDEAAVSDHSGISPEDAGSYPGQHRIDTCCAK